MTVTMGELNGNEKYFFREESLPANTQRPGQIHTSDLMLCGSDCLVLFYESFSSSYPYTTPGQINDPGGSYLPGCAIRGSTESPLCLIHKPIDRKPSCPKPLFRLGWDGFISSGGILMKRLRCRFPVTIASTLLFFFTLHAVHRREPGSPWSRWNRRHKQFLLQAVKELPPICCGNRSANCGQ